MELDDPWRDWAQTRGPIPDGTFRVVAESDGRTSVTDFVSREDAFQYADDAASESDHPPPLAKVYDAQLRLVHEGLPYWSTPGIKKDAEKESKEQFQEDDGKKQEKGKAMPIG